MARKAIVVKQQRLQQEYLQAIARGKKPKYPTRVYRRCQLCGRQHSVMRAFGICRICFRELASNGEMPGIKKSSW